MSPTPSKKKDEEEEPSNFGLARVFKYQELKKATNSFGTELGAGGFGRVYLGTLPDGREVAVKELFDRNPNRRLEQFFNEVTVLPRLRHENLITLYGCTNPLRQHFFLVYDYVPNGTVAEHLHCQRSDLTLAVRIQIAVETAAALSYLHALEPPIIHRDVKTSNILLDNALHAKVADLGICRHLPWDTAHVSTLPQGTLGYRDPDYDSTFLLTDKSDVYSLGVVLIELISGQQAVDVNRNPDDIYLDRLALKKILNNNLKDFVDPKLGYHSNRGVKRVINAVAELARVCLHPKGLMRPSMVAVLCLLKQIQKKILEIEQNGYGNLNNGVEPDGGGREKKKRRAGCGHGADKKEGGSGGGEERKKASRSERGADEKNDGGGGGGEERRKMGDSGGGMHENNDGDGDGDAKKPAGSVGGGSDGKEHKNPAGDQKPKSPQASTVLLKVKSHCWCEGCTHRMLK